MSAAGPQSNASSAERARPHPKHEPLEFIPGERISSGQKVSHPSEVILTRHCFEPGCQRPTAATLTYDCRDSTVILEPPATLAEPNAYDLYDHHAERLIVPRDWQVVRLVTDLKPAPPSGDGLLALADAVRRAAEAQRYATPEPPVQSLAATRPTAREAERGPFAPKREPDTSNPPDPDPSYTKRRARFMVISDDWGCYFPQRGERARGYRTPPHK